MATSFAFVVVSNDPATPSLSSLLRGTPRFSEAMTPVSRGRGRRAAVAAPDDLFVASQTRLRLERRPLGRRYVRNTSLKFCPPAASQLAPIEGSILFVVFRRDCVEPSPWSSPKVVDESLHRMSRSPFTGGVDERPPPADINKIGDEWPGRRVTPVRLDVLPRSGSASR